MNLTVLFFGATAEATGSKEYAFQIRYEASVADALKELVGRFAGLKHHKLLVAVNQEHAQHETRLKDGDELAIFTPVSGG